MVAEPPRHLHVRRQTNVAWFTVDTVEPGSRGELQQGWGWVQFCITTDEDLDAVKMEWSRVVKNS